MRGKYLHILIAGIVAGTISCRKIYAPPVIVATNSYLVVEGVINAGSDSTFIKLSRTQQLSDKADVKPETGASVAVTGGAAGHQLTEKTPGVYVSAGLNLDKSRKYQLSVKTANGAEYLSDAVEVKVTPPIDSISYVVKSDGVDINVNAHDPSNNTRYYRWSYDETWRFHSKHISDFKVVGNQVIKRTPDEQVYYCFANDTSSTIVLGSTTKLEMDRVADLRITHIADSSEKISVRYSINLKQYALTRQSYEFWENLKKNTEQLGSVFDALPSQLTGNLHNVANAKEPVIGYVDISTVSVKRIFIDESVLPNFQTKYPYECETAAVLYNHDGVDEVASNLLNGLYFPTQGIYSTTGALLGFIRSPRECADCTFRGRVEQPSFWR